jgi:transposase
MLARLLLPDADLFELDDVTIDDVMITLSIHATQPTATCPDCHQSSRRVHSHYWRTVADLPCMERSVRVRLFVRRFFCDNPLCVRKTFAERFADAIAPFARRTNRLTARQRVAGQALGGEAGAQLLATFALPASGDTLLRLIRSTSTRNAPALRVLGIDDWAYSRGQRYGTILVDLERHCPVDLLPDRSADTVCAWLQAHPGVEIVSRDRAPEYIDGINRGAPEATQVADRFHLLRNLKEALQRLLDQNQACLYAAAADPGVRSAQPPVPELQPALESAPPQEAVDSALQTQAEQRRQAARERRQARYQAVIDLHQQGIKMRAIARQLKMSRETVRRYLRAGGFPETRQRRKRHSVLEPYLAYLKQRWTEGCHNGSQLYRELKQQGYTRSRALVGRWVAQMRKQEPTPASDMAALPKVQQQVVRPWSARYASWLLLKVPEVLSTAEKGALERMLQASATVRRAYGFAQSFVRMVRYRFSRSLDPWLRAVTENQIPELSSLAQGIGQDKAAVLAALSLPWSNGQVEGQVNRLKLIKRQMYGRAKFDLLRARVLFGSGP